GVAKYDQLVQGLEDNRGINQILEIEYLDFLKNSDEEYRQILENLYDHKYKNRHFDYIITIGKNVDLDFEKRFQGDKYIYLESYYGLDNVEIEKVSLERFIEIIIKMQPDLRNIYIQNFYNIDLIALRGKYRIINFFKVDLANSKTAEELMKKDKKNALILADEVNKELLDFSFPVYSYKLVPNDRYTVSLIRDYYMAGKNLASVMLNKKSRIKLDDISYLINDVKSKKYNLYLDPLGTNIKYFNANIINIDRGIVMYVLLSVFSVLNLIFILIGMRWSKMVKKYKKLKIIAEENSKIKDRFLANMTHELRTPLNGIIGMVEIMKNHSRSKKLQVIDASAKHLLSMVNDILDFSKLTAEKENIDISLIDVKNLMNEIILIFSSINGIQISCNVDGDMPKKVYGDYLKLKQVLINLMSNAVKFTNRGSVSLDVKVMTKTSGNVSVDFSVSDTGIGIPGDKIDRLFDSFTQIENFHSRTYGGTGLGLTIVKQLITLLGTELVVESEVGKGSRFSFQMNFKVGDDSFNSEKRTAIVVADKRAFILKELSKLGIETITADEEDAMEIKKAFGNAVIFTEKGKSIEGTKIIENIEDTYELKDDDYILLNPFININLIPDEKEKDENNLMCRGHVLVVEDNVVNANILKEYLKKSIEVDIAYNAEDVKNKDLSKYDLILMDIELPGMSGIELTKKLKTEIPVIALTAHSLERYREECLAAGMKGFLTKPIEFDKLNGILHQYLHLDMEELTEYYGKDFLNKIIEVYLEESDELLNDLKTNKKSAAHKLKGSIGYFKRDDIIKLLEEIENENFTLMDELLEKLELFNRMLGKHGGKDESSDSGRQLNGKKTGRRSC
ncbi:ATP-binding protein, partial [Ilyobacter sp.]|uniref:hybrid sensor histidine kinase/response regulator n=1 Tax=Ilyobacter sp. TaxID=3100343 RepID=UPI003565E2B1